MESKIIMKSGLFLFLIFLMILSNQNYCKPISNNNKDKNQIISLEKVWLKNLHNKTVLNTILASDYVHTLPQGIFINKEQQINYMANHSFPEGVTQKFDTLFVRVYGNTGIANGIVETLNKYGKSIRKSIFTDIFVKRMGRWQAVSSQENLIK